MADDTKPLATPMPPAASPVQVPATPAVDPACVVSDDEPLIERDPFYGQGGDFKIDEATGKRVRV